MTAASASNRLHRAAVARWEGSLAQGEGRLSTDSHTLAEARYSFPARFGQEAGTNPEELIAAAHAGCYSMALAYLLGRAGSPPAAIETRAVLMLERQPAGPEVIGIQLRVRATVPGIDRAAFASLASEAKSSCLVSRLLDTPIALDAELV